MLCGRCRIFGCARARAVGWMSEEWRGNSRGRKIIGFICVILAAERSLRCLRYRLSVYLNKSLVLPPDDLLLRTSDIVECVRTKRFFFYPWRFSAVFGQQMYYISIYKQTAYPIIHPLRRAENLSLILISARKKGEEFDVWHPQKKLLFSVSDARSRQRDRERGAWLARSAWLRVCISLSLSPRKNERMWTLQDETSFFSSL